MTSSVLWSLCEATQRRFLESCFIVTFLLAFASVAGEPMDRCSNAKGNVYETEAEEGISLLQRHTKYASHSMMNALDPSHGFDHLSPPWDRSYQVEPGGNWFGANTSGTSCQPSLVVDVGLPRTGTESFIYFMSGLGYTGWHYFTGNPDYPRAHTWDAPHDPWYRTTFWQTKPKNLAVADSPWMFLSCQLHQSQPKPGTTKFVYIKRDLLGWHKSLMSMFCTYDDPRNSGSDCEGFETPPPGNYIHGIGQLMYKWCHRDKDICDTWARRGTNAPHFWEDHKIVRWMANKHEEVLHQCVPKEDLLQMDLFDEHKAQKIGHFLGCNQNLPAYPILHKSS